MSQSVKRYLHIVEYERSINRRNVGFGSEDLERRVERPLVEFVLGAARQEMVNIGCSN